MATLYCYILIVVQFATLVQCSRRCCMYEQWEGMMFLVRGATDEGATPDKMVLSYSNGTARVSYDLTNSRSYIAYDGYTTSSSSGTKRNRWTIISDYDKGVQYIVSENRTCEKAQTTDNIGQICASELVKNTVYPNGSLPGKMPLINIAVFPTTYYVTISATLTKGTRHCMPLFFSGTSKFDLSNSGSGFGLELLDIKEGIKNKDIFTPPPSCPHQLQNHDSTLRHLMQLFH